MHRAWRVCALSIERLEGSRPRLRRMRALWKLNGVKGRPSRCIGAVRRSTADDTTRSGDGYCGKMLRRECVRKPEEEIVWR